MGRRTAGPHETDEAAPDPAAGPGRIRDSGHRSSGLPVATRTPASLLGVYTSHLTVVEGSG
ncbi:hypothetical protein [uncultured Methylobacterium sp.]|uniref:hypothetical protein n=1 Tax=uncultured Methylobacterium sp. TaxID=157278 RepID=UPI0035CAADE0